MCKNHVFRERMFNMKKRMIMDSHLSKSLKKVSCYCPHTWQQVRLGQLGSILHVNRHTLTILSISDNRYDESSYDDSSTFAS